MAQASRSKATRGEFRAADSPAYVTLVSHAAEVFGGSEGAYEWLRRPNAALGDRSPAELLRDEEGLNEVERLLVRLEHGVYS